MKILESDLPLFPLHAVLFPQARLPLQIFEPRYIEMINQCVQEDLAFGVVLIKEGSEVGDAAVPRQVGTIARIADLARLEDGRMNIIASGVTRFRLLETHRDRAFLTGKIELWRDENVDIAKAEPMAKRAARSFQKYVEAIQNVAGTESQPSEEGETESEFKPPKDPTLLSYLIATSLQVSNGDKQSLLETRRTIARLHREIVFMDREVELLRLISEKSNRVLDQGTFSLN